MKIVTDCAADMSVEELEQLGVTQAPLFIQFPEGEVSSVDITADEFYNRLEAMRPQIPTTAQPSSGLFAELYRKLAQLDRDILSIHISSGLSGTINAARAGGAQVEAQANVSYWDSLTLSGGQRFQVLAAAYAARAGRSLAAIQKLLQDVREKTEVIYTLDTLEYLARGGRIGRVRALAGAMLNLKPVIRVDQDGKYSTVTTARTLGKAINAIVDQLIVKYRETSLWVTILHGRCADKADILSDEIRSRLKIGRMEIQRISPVLGVHTGPGIVGAAAVPIDLLSDLLK